MEVNKQLIRCDWAMGKTVNEEYQEYHDTQWGVPVHDDHVLFEMLILEGMQAGLSWFTILNKRENFRKAFDNFEPDIIIHYEEKKIENLMQDAGIIRNRLKINSVLTNAGLFLEIQKVYGSFDKFIWSYIDNKPIMNNWTEMSQVPAKTALSDKISKDMKKIGFKFVGSTIIYAYMQSIGMVDDHLTTCFRHVLCRTHATIK